MRNANSKYVPLVLWGLLALGVLFLVLPWPRGNGPLFGQTVAASPAPATTVSKTTLIYGQAVMTVDALMTKVFGKTVPVAVPRPTPAPVASPAAPQFGPDPGLRSLGTMIVDQNKKWLLSDPATGLTFAIAPGESYGGWRCVGVEGGFLILERGGTRYRVASN